MSRRIGIKNESMENNKLWTVGQFAAAANLSPATIRMWILSRRLATVRLGRAVRIPASELERLIMIGTTPAKEQA